MLASVTLAVEEETMRLEGEYNEINDLVKTRLQRVEMPKLALINEKNGESLLPSRFKSSKERVEKGAGATRTR